MTSCFKVISNNRYVLLPKLSFYLLHFLTCISYLVLRAILYMHDYYYYYYIR